MSAAAELASGKGHKDENFPVASHLIRPRHRAPIMAFYHFARAADDIADNESASADEKLAGLEAMRRTLLGQADSEPTAEGLRAALTECRLDPTHPLNLLEAFRRDVTKTRYQSWDALIDYCRYSAMPVGRFVLDVHGEDRALWPANDALCAALQIINHLQDCGDDYRTIDRVYLPQDMLAGYGARTEDIGAASASPALRSVIVDMASRCEQLLAQSAAFARSIRDGRLALEVAVIQRLAIDLSARLRTRDPLSERIVHRKTEALGLALRAVIGRWLGR
ncbi:squalene synthase HpnC [Sphingomonas sp. MMS24-J13]|uniref:squalene synthase HpnC n=1 Tax=Sphingomonas sp. MMS24-J13 TaxID=3238686 RepID=UPI00384DBB8A